MAVLLTVYHLLLEREKMHRFNRFYLLGALVFSLALPFINIPVYVAAPVQSFQATAEASEIIMAPQIAQSAAPGMVIKPATNYIPYIVWSTYGMITILLAIRFTLNISYFIRKSARNEKVAYKNAQLVLLKENILPHTFLKYIFINEDDYRANAIEDDLYTHELTHVKQRHTLDILFIEALKTIFWFNPMLYFYKKAIQLNHEFLADEGVIKTSDTPKYQRLLLQKTAYSNIALASNLTFSLTKKRFNMMTKTTPKWKLAALQISVAPVITAMMLLLCIKSVAQEKNTQLPDRIEVETVTRQELDSLQKADPVKYKGKETDFMKTTMTHANEKDKHKDTVSYNRKATPVYEEHQFSAISKIDNSKIKGIEILQLTDFERNTLKELDPEKYNDSTFKDYMAVKVTFINENGQPEAITTFEKKPKYE